MRDRQAIIESARAKREEIAAANFARDEAERIRKVEIAKRDSAIRASKPRPSYQENHEGSWEIMAGMKSWETLVTQGGRSWVE
jgi:hypothetical protein